MRHDAPPDRKHLQRLDQVWLECPIYFITFCVYGRHPILASEFPAKIINDAFEQAFAIYGWAVGRYVIMPDHVHFFCSQWDEKNSLSEFVRHLKRFTSRKISSCLNIEQPVWQKEFFDHLLRSQESYDNKWEYVLQNPVRAGLVNDPGQWQYQGEFYVLK